MHEVCIHTVYLAHENSNGEMRGRRYNKNSKRVLWNLEQRNVRIIKGKNPKQGLVSAKDLTIELPDGRDFPNIDYIISIYY